MHLTGYALNINDLKAFRQLHSKTPGHPESFETPGVETTTGPLGQGLANAVGMAIAEKTLAAEFNKDEHTLVDHYTYAFAGDGCLMEGISHEACSFAGTLGLGKLIVFYDDNGISIDGRVDGWFADNTAERFRAYHWQVIENVDGHDMNAIEAAINSARSDTTKPTLIMCKTIIGYGSRHAGSESVHGSPLGSDDIKHIRQEFNWPYPPFVIPDEIYAQWNHEEEGMQDEQQWLQNCQAFAEQYPDEYSEFLRRSNGDLPDTWSAVTNRFIEQCQSQEIPIATRKASQQCIQEYAAILPELLGGSADLTGSNNTNWSGCQTITHDKALGNYIHYGVREFAMSAIMNGLSRHGGFIPFGGTFLVFADYAKNAIRLSAIMHTRVIYVLTHDSIGLGEDGPTHQPIEHAAMLRLTPNVQVWRPADLMETAVAWQQAIERHNGPSCLLLSRQNLPANPYRNDLCYEINRGAYILQDGHKAIPDVILIATGSEVQLALAAVDHIKQKDVSVRVISMPCAERFLEQEASYQEHVLPKAIRKRVAIEAAASGYWYRFVGLDGVVIGLEGFGASAPAADIYRELGITVEKIVNVVDDLFGE